MTYTFIIGNILAVVLFNYNVLEACGWSMIIANVLPAIYLLYKGLKLSGNSFPGSGPFGNSTSVLDYVLSILPIFR